jgi:two-component system CheB/CheR fusion protein
MPVVEVSDKIRPEPNRVHVIQPNSSLTMSQGVLRCETPRAGGMTIDPFFLSVAADQGENVVGIILSGSGSDGATGIKAIKEHGGLTIAQETETSRYDSMPRSAAATGAVDFVLPIEEMPARLIVYAKHLERLKTAKTTDGFRQELDQHLARIHTLLRAKVGHDFSQYKESTFVRRLQRRMQVAQLASVSEYVELLRRDPDEVEALFRDLLISVTQFFREPEAFKALERIIEELLAEKSEDDAFRVWVPGCATGEEAYSIAILICEKMRARDLNLNVQIFGTDIDDEALATARHGLYPDTIVRDVSAGRLKAFFHRESHSFRVINEIREMCVFAPHNLIKDPPFSRLDLVSCRNLMIYFDNQLQSKVLLLFHFALRPGGYLFLGSSENVTEQSKLFSRIENKFRIFKTKPVEGERVGPIFPLGAGTTRFKIDGAFKTIPELAAKESVARRAQRVAESYSPAFVIVDENFDIVHFSGRTGRYLQPSPGAATLNLFNIADSGLRPDLRTLIHKAASSGRRAVHDNLAFPVNGGMQTVNLIAEPLTVNPGEPRLCVVIFQESRPGEDPTFPPEGVITPEMQRDAIVHHLESELVTSRERLQTTIEELETTNEEMKAANEEFQSLNEELQTSNEELETSKEELQSINEELETVNAELNSKVESLDRALADQKNLLENTQIPTLFLDCKLRIKSFTPAISDLFHLRSGDLNRPITEITSKTDYDNFPADVARVLRTLAAVEKEVTISTNGASYILRILPYRTLDNAIDGVVVTFIDISERKRKEEALARLAAVALHSVDALIGIDLTGRIITWNAGAERMYGYTSKEAVGKPFAMLLPEERQQEAKEILKRLKRDAVVATTESARLTKTKRQLPVSYTAAPVTDPEGKLVAGSIIDRDISEQAEAAKRQSLLLSELNHRVKNTLATVLSIAARTQRSSKTLEGYSRAFEGRIKSLTSAHDLLSRNIWTGVHLRELIRLELRPYDVRRARNPVEGPDIFVSPQAGLILAMVFHELATNAAKYGSLSQKGHVSVEWTLTGPEKRRRLTLYWKEYDGPKVAKPGAASFGLTFIERSLSYELGGEAKVAFKPTGLEAKLQLPLENVVPPREASRSRRRPTKLRRKSDA